MLIVMFYIAPEVGGGEGVNLSQKIISNLQFYIDTETTTQFKTPILLLVSIIIAGYYYIYRKLRTEIMICVMWFVVSLAPFLITRQLVQPTYLIEANLSAVLLIGIIISECFKNPKFDIPMGLIILGIIFQVSMVPTQISNMQNYNHMVSDNQKTFFETVESLKQIPSNSIVFYFPDSTRQKYGMQLTEDFFRNYLCIRNLCDIKIVTNYTNANYIILPSSLDVYIFQKEMPNERPLMISQIKNGNDYGYLLLKVNASR